MSKRSNYKYIVQVSDTVHKFVSAKEFKELSHHWEPSKVIRTASGEITIYTVENIECGRRIETFNYRVN